MIKGNAEELPFEDCSLQGISCVYLFHELPRTVRENVLKEVEENYQNIKAFPLDVNDKEKCFIIYHGKNIIEV